MHPHRRSLSGILTPAVPREVWFSTPAFEQQQCEKDRRGRADSQGGCMLFKQLLLFALACARPRGCNVVAAFFISRGCCAWLHFQASC